MKTDNYHANTVRYLDKKQNKSLIQFNDEYDQNGILKRITFIFIGVGSSSGMSMEYVYDFEKLTINNIPFYKENKLGSKEDLKDYLLNRFNKNPNFTLICPKEDCNDPNCKPNLSIGNKIEKSENTKRPYFSSNCNGINYGESAEHLNAKIQIHKLVVEKAASYAKKNSSTRIENIEIEKTFSFGNGQERRADIYYEKHYVKNNAELVIEKFAIEVQRSNINYEELTERTNWYKNQGITTFWIVVDDMFKSDPERVEALSKKDFGLPLLSLISFSMKNYNHRFYIYDDKKRKIIPLTIQQAKITQFNDIEEEEQRKFKSKFSIDKLYIISNIKEPNDNQYCQLLAYKTNRTSYNIGVDILSFSVFSESKDLKQNVWDKITGKYVFAQFKAISKPIIPSKFSNDNIQKSHQILKHKM